MEYITGAIFKTYSGKKINVRFTFPYRILKDGEYNRQKEKLADMWNEKCRQDRDPIASCEKLILE